MPELTVAGVDSFSRKWCAPEKRAEFIRELAALIEVAVRESTDYIIFGRSS
jgi:hypothetical protein